ncbi:MAG: DNA polymerase III subunit gamma/tau [Clostridia bacterium]|nr:DNA polymerase III subunit gamma/tau [Clostridia bacterium]
MYYALYRKYRPLSFGDVLGQQAITETLQRQVATGQISHAYLFTGTRGTGKTTCAKILARAVNCLNPKDGNPCNECSVCKGLLEGTLYDVEEIDAASNNGVENIRQIREEVVYTPTAAKYKVYIIDEVHMLSTGAFNALLKTLEEPPAHAIFILATTEIHKVPATILSRCQRFDFLRLAKKTLVEQFRDVLKKEGKSLDENALDLIAELADGSSRDGLSILDKVIDLNSREEVESVLGVIPKKRIFDLLTAAADGDTDTMYRAVEDLYNASADMGRLCTDLMHTMKDVMIFRSAKNPAALLEKSEADLRALEQIAARFAPERILYSLRILQETVAMLPRSLDKRSDTEVCMLRLARPDLQPDPKDLAARLATVEQQLRELKKNSVVPAVSIPEGTDLDARSKAIPQAIPETIPEKLTPAPSASGTGNSASGVVPSASGVVPSASGTAHSGSEVVPSANGTAHSGSEVVPSASEVTSREKPEKTQRKAPPVFDDPFANPSVSSSGTYHEPVDEAPGRPTQKRTPPREIPPRTESADETFVEGWQPLDAWKDIAHTVSRQNRILGFLLKKAPAVYQGRTILVIAENDEDYREIKSQESLQLILAALEENRKEGYTVRIENCPTDKYIPHATINYLQKENLFDFGDDEKIPEYDD